MFSIIFLLSSLSVEAPKPQTLPVTVITASAPAWVCSAPRDLLQGSGSVRTCYAVGGRK